MISVDRVSKKKEESAVHHSLFEGLNDRLVHSNDGLYAPLHVPKKAGELLQQFAIIPAHEPLRPCWLLLAMHHMRGFQRTVNQRV
jgi:hypothetical protein